MADTRNLLYYLIFDNISYKDAFDIHIETASFDKGIDPSAKLPTGENEKLSFIAEKNDKVLNTLSLSLEPENEEFLIDLLIRSNEVLIVYAVCFGLNVIGSPLALPALLNKKNAHIAGTIEEIDFSIDRIQKRYGVTSEQLNVLKSPEFKNICWCKSALTFFCLFSLMAEMLGWDIDDPAIETVGDFLIRELRVEKDGLDSIKAFRLCYLGTQAYFDEMKHFKKLIESESLFGGVLKDTDIKLSAESDLKELYHEIMVEFLNIRLIENFENIILG
ncbi:hypothetical protein DIU31_005905 [Mucilaginibacter rubeus]|uniref:Uncharacterized protein n=1 Tax=Mucilaginibacter rubeus TaxID=2027860 RepID=A0AAE6JCT8_9SPHI|nr:MULTISPECIES: hypothetical protein [Mucilaginibacter]QEM03076.1 hypothetical protein DIU31_005905 [Mucilaginibacter rubeus]QEM15695.1 hypothetical protein DIU38_005975 [Mucilaginibacter gossypii]QTE41566.1 hypothetical protein J3L19_21805 [Mucilaginibacter rubeus]QTE48172.1 hypothetical protein J3L21_21805 [Mucilaginibacter rubeus]QTE59563.1 hypothetical protein J3L23_13450 [Mucilaginibacter rubeus]